jgi:uncharacterized protein (TIGR03067 family)
MGVRLVILCVALTLGVSASGDEPAALTGDLAKLQGTWETKAGPLKDQPLRMTIKGTDLTLRYSIPGRKEPMILEGRIALDEKTQPSGMDWLDMHIGNQELPPVYSIYELKEDRLRVRGSGAKVRPTEFQDDDDVPRHRSLQFQRVQDGDASK